MSSHMAVATKEQPASMRRTKMDFWNGMEHGFMMPSITSKERTAVWDAVAGYVQEELLLRKGVRIPTLGSFDVVPKWIQVGNEAVIIQRPVFRLARNLAGVHNLRDNKDYLPGNKELEPLKYAKVAAAASVSRRKVEACIQGTMSLLSHCLGKGENVALVLRDIGLLLIEGMRVQMKFFYNFLERMSGKENLEKAAFKVPQLLDMVVSQVVPVASLTFSGRVIIFPEFELEFVPKPPPRAPVKHLRKVPGEDKRKEEEVLPALRQGKKVGFAELPLPACSSSTPNEAPQLREMKEIEKRKKSRVRPLPLCPFRWLPLIPGDSSGIKQPVTSQPKGKSKLEGQASKQSRAQAAKPGRCRGGGQGEKKVPVGSKLLSMSSEAGLPEEPTYKVFIPQPPRPEAAPLLKSRPEMFWSVVKEPQKTVLAGYSFEPSLLVPPMYEESRSTQCHPLKTRSVVSRMEWPWLE
ncbi:hypothetical protein QYF61_016241 [Mycteria americana]|uniref:Uncharacterized protein n=1 Tax=Mycteria americana TaxID=33587 RepID=A0AAN7N849_MYCAM|nr:hypothetical protein QYF61_016241 [Mycteria americana]